MDLFSSIVEKDVPRINQTEYLINGEIRHWDGPVADVLSPICLRTPEGLHQASIGSYPMLTSEVALEALNAAVEAYGNGAGSWPSMPVEARIAFVLKFVEQMKLQKNLVVSLLMWEIGKTLDDSTKEFDRTVQYILDTVEALKNIDRESSRFVKEGGIYAQIRRAPLGVVLCMGPFNYPLNETFTTLIPALIMGNTILFKPPKLGVLLHQPLLECFKVFPKGVVNTIYGDGPTVVGPLMASGKIDVLAFIGTSKVADILRKQHPKPHRMKGVLGLESKNAGIILDSADIDLTVKECLTGTLSYNGQRCTALKMLFVHKKVYLEFVAKFTEAVKTLVMGMPWEQDVTITPLPEPGKVEYLHGLVEDAVNQGASLVIGDQWEGTIFCPTILIGITDKMRIYSEEQFGPIIPIMAFDDESFDLPRKFVTESNYGQQVSIFGTVEKDIAYFIDVMSNQVCRININSQCQRGPDSFPFTGRKDSAEGTLSITDALKVFSIRTMVAAKANTMNNSIIERITVGQKSTFLSTKYIL